MMKYNLILVEDNPEQGRELMKNLTTEFERRAHEAPVLAGLLPTRIPLYESIGKLIEVEQPDPHEFYAWITDWQLGGEKTNDNNTSVVIYSALAILLEDSATPGSNRGLPLLHGEYQRLNAAFGLQGRQSLLELVANSGFFCIYTSHPEKPAFRPEVELAYSKVGGEEAPLVLFKEKTPQRQRDIQMLVEGYFIAAHAYQGKVPLLGKLDGPLPVGRAQLPKAMADGFSVARSSNNQLDAFIEKHFLGQALLDALGKEN